VEYIIFFLSVTFIFALTYEGWEFAANRPKSLRGKGLGRAGRPPSILSPLVATTYDKSLVQIPCQKNSHQIAQKIVG